MDINFLNRIEINPKVLCGKPIIKGTRISVELILEKLAEGYTFDEIMKEYDIERNGIKAAIFYAQKIIANEKILEAV